MNRRYSIVIAVVFLAIAGCRDKYNPSIHYPDTGYLVVEGFINSGQGPTQIKLSRTQALNDPAGVQPERGAQVTVEGDDSGPFILNELSEGTYVNDQLQLHPSGKYRLHIGTANGKIYYSDFASPIKTPPIDSLNWIRESDGITIHVNTHDPQNNTHYYTWSFEETWEIDATYVPNVKFVYDSEGKIIGTSYIYPDEAPDTSGHRCWKFGNSTTILTASSAKLSQDVVHAPLIHIANKSEKLFVLYSALVSQHGVSPQGYEFLQRLKKNTEETGSIFDSQPSELNNNIHNIADSSEIVFGYVDVSDLQQSRVFIDSRDLDNWGFSQGCEYIPVYPRSNPDSLRAYSSYSPVDYISYNGFKAIGMATPVCVDCRLSGGINQRPSYWPR